jgi:hypothetical protein
MRFPVEARVTFRWIDQTGVQHKREGRTLNISELGTFVRSREHPPERTPVELTVFLPHVENSRLVPTPMMMQGTVVRIQRGQHAEEPYGFAIEVKSVNSA